MFLKRKALLTALSFFAVSGCVSTVEIEQQQQQITHLESSLNTSKTLMVQTQSELDTAKEALKIQEDKINTLTTALTKSQTALQSSQAVVTPSPIKILHSDDKTILGQTEWVYVSKVKENFKGRIDTGAATSSINAVDIQRFERDGTKWVRFNLTHAEGENADMIEAKVIRIAKIRQSSQLGESVERPVIQLHVRIGDVAQLTEFTLTNRQQMAYPVLIGRTFMRDVILVDVSKEYNFPKYQAPTENK